MVLVHLTADIALHIAAELEGAVTLHLHLVRLGAVAPTTAQKLARLPSENIKGLYWVILGYIGLY